METSSEVLLKSLREYYKDPAALQKLTELIGTSMSSTKKQRVSLRIIDWCVVNYAKAKNTAYIVYPDGAGGGTEQRVFYVFLDYKSQLKGFSKGLFDVFKRGKRVHITGSDGSDLETTVAQLNFFRWALRYKVVDYCEKHMNEIEKDMLRATREKPEKRTHLSKLGSHANPTTMLRVKITFV